VGLGTSRHRVVLYPISHPDAEGLADINWIAEQTFDASHDWTQSGWFRPVALSEFAHEFEGFVYDWLDLPALLAGSDAVYENPMIDRDPVPTWQDGRAGLIGDAAHVMYPTGSNGASQAIVDARVLGACMLACGVTPEALARYDAALCKDISAVILRNRGAGPFGLLNMVDERCGGRFDSIDAVVPPAERQEFMARYKAAAGFAKDRLNAAGPTIAPGARVPGAA
jgi:2-polyprenyl-6-methoxyphenol hydroxylase-like FAD-dependent oxidoreductase